MRKLRFYAYIIGFFVAVPSIVMAQSWHHNITINSRMGYTTNSYLNNYITEWDTINSSYMMITPAYHISHYSGQNAYHVTGGLYYQPYFQDLSTNWNGGYMYTNFNRRWNESVFTGINMGGNIYRRSDTRKVGWIEPYIRMLLTDNTKLTARFGSTFRGYGPFSVDSLWNRYDMASLNVTSWLSYKFRLQLGASEDLEEIASPGDGLSTYAGIDYYFRNGARASLNAGYERYKYKTNVDAAENVSRHDNIYTVSLSGTYPVTPRLSVKLSTSYLHLNSTKYNAPSSSDIEVNAGITYSIIPGWGRRGKVGSPSIKKQEGDETLFTVTYRGEGKLYLTGDFNDWERPGIPLIKGPNNTYRTSLEVEEGIYEYKILKIEGDHTQWLDLPEEVVTVQDGFGGENGRIVIDKLKR